MSEPRSPQAFVLDEPERDDQPQRKPRAITGITFEPEVDEGALIVMPPAVARPARFRWGALLFSALFTLVTMWAGLSITKLVEDFFARSPILGWTALAVAGIAAFAALAIILREIWALARLRRIEHIQVDAAHAINTDDSAAAKRAVLVDKTREPFVYRPAHRRESVLRDRLREFVRASGLPSATSSTGAMRKRTASSPMPRVA